MRRRVGRMCAGARDVPMRVCRRGRRCWRRLQGRCCRRSCTTAMRMCASCIVRLARRRRCRGHRIRERVRGRIMRRNRRSTARGWHSRWRCTHRNRPRARIRRANIGRPATSRRSPRRSSRSRGTWAIRGTTRIRKWTPLLVWFSRSI